MTKISDKHGISWDVGGVFGIEQCSKCSKPLIELSGTCCVCNPDRDRWNKLKERIEEEILYLCDLGRDKSMRELCAEQTAMMRIQEIMQELEEK
jgi:hypothetical protein